MNKDVSAIASFPAFPLRELPPIVLPLLEDWPLCAFWLLVLLTSTLLVLLTLVLLRLLDSTIFVECGPVIPIDPPPFPALLLKVGRVVILPSVRLVPTLLLLPALPLPPPPPIVLSLLDDRPLEAVCAFWFLTQRYCC